jgi:Immunoglobulin I-set domain
MASEVQRGASLLQVPGNENRAKSPFEIGEKPDMQIASSKAIIDKALIMDVSGGITKNIDEYISLFFTDFCALDKASCADISEVKVVIVEEVEEPEVIEEVVEEEDPDMVEIEVEVSEEEVGEDGETKRVKRKVMKKVHKDEVPKEEEAHEETAAERKRRERAEKLAAKKVAEGGGDGGEADNEADSGDEGHEGEKADENEAKPEDGESNVGGGEDDDDDTASVTSETSTKKKTKKKKKKGAAAPEPIPEPEPEPIEEIPEPEPEPKEPDSDDDLIYPKEVFDNPDVWQKIDSDELLSAEEQARIASARESVHLMTERERDLEWQRQRTLLRPPLVVSHLKSRAGPKGGSVKMTCTVTGPELTVKWMKDDNPIEKNFEKYRFQVTETLLSLEILNLDSKDAGDYMCIIKNKNGECDTRCLVKVYEPFEIKPIPPTFISIKGN